MKEFQKRNAGNIDAPFPGCMGRMVNLFDLSPGMAANRLLTEKAHLDGSIISRGRSDVTKRRTDPVGERIEDKQVAYDLKRNSSNKKSIGTSMKMLIAEEMLKETESKHKPPGVVARLMGLDALPAQQPVSTTEGGLPEGYLQKISAKPGSVLKYRQQENVLLDKRLPCEVHTRQVYASQQHKCKDVYEVWQQSSKMNYIKDQPRENGRYNESSKEKKMALVRQKFLEAKRLATDEKLRQSQEFQDALEVLSSNRELFLKFLQEPSSLFSKHIYEFQSIPPPPQTKRITVLKPSKTLETDRCSGPESMSEKQAKKQHQVAEVNGWDKDKPGWSSVYEQQKADKSQPTRIVVLKPSPGKTHDIKAVASSPTTSPRFLHGRDSCDSYGKSGTDETRRSREIAKEITGQMRESMTSNQSSEALLSSVLWNGYVGDESSFNRSENDYIEEGNLSDSEVLTPNSRHSWDYINRYSSPYSTSSFGRASYSPESSVTREAKKRLSERWVMMTSNGSNQEQRVHRRSSSTLGEMLAFPATKKPGTSENLSNDGGLNVSNSRLCDGEQELREPTASLLPNSENRNEGGDDAPRNLIRSRSLPVSSTACEKVGLNAGASDPRVSSSIVSGELTRPKSGKSSLKGRVSSLFFSRNKKPSKEKSSTQSSVGSLDVSEPASAEMAVVTSETKQLPADRHDYTSQCVHSNQTEEGLLPSRVEFSSNISSPSICVGPRAGTLPSEGVFSPSKSAAHANSSDNIDQPSPISVLEAPFEDDNDTPQSIRISDAENRESPGLVHQDKSESTTKCAIESVTRALSWDDANLEVATTNSVEASARSSKVEEEEREWYSFVQTLLSAAGLDQEKFDRVFTRWHSLESPLDPSLLEKYMDRKEEDQQLSEAKRRQRRSEKRLLYDCVNAALLELSVSSLDDKSCARSRGKNVVLVSSMPVTELVWNRVKEWFLGEAKQFPGECDSSLLVEMVVRKEVVGRGWMELMGLEVDGIGKEIEKEMLKDLIEESFAELT